MAKKKGNGGTREKLSFLFAFGFFIIIGSLVFYFLSQKRLPILPITPIPTTTVSISPTPVDISNWKTYSNTKYSYSFKYPPLYEFSQPAGNYLSNAQHIDGSMVGLSFDVFANYEMLEKCKSIQSCQDSQITRLNLSKGDAIEVTRMVGGMVAKGFKYFFVNPLNKKSSWLEEVYLNVDGHIYVFHSGLDESRNLEPELVRMLSTFKFTK